MNKVLIFGAGSIGNHMSYACLRLKCDVYITDKDPSALERMRDEIFPKRYGKWDKNIKLLNFKNLKKLNKKFDLIILGTPPKSHLGLYDFCRKNIEYDKLLIEKPLFVYNQDFKKIKFDNNKIFCGYNHSISKSFLYFQKRIINEPKNKIISIEVDWKEGWNGILNAHFWMKNEFDSYLGNLRDGGGSLHEHSHGLHLLTVLLKNLKINIKNINFSKKILFKKKKTKKYDSFGSFIALCKDILIKYETDLLTFPSKKEIRVNYNNKCLIWRCNFKKDIDCVEIITKKKKKLNLFKKTRSSEFENEIRYILSNKNKINSNLDISNSIQTIKSIKSFLITKNKEI